MDDNKFRGKYRISSSRLKNWDYSADAHYFVTVCAKNQEHYFGEIINEKMELAKMGEIAQKCWQAIPDHFPFVVLDEYIVMPNHIHGILIIDKSKTADIYPVETQHFASLQKIPKPKWKPNRFGPQSNNLASIIRGFKIGVKKFATINNISFQWQPRFYDHIIRNESSLNHIRQYIINNPENWERDRNNPQNLYM